MALAVGVNAYVDVDTATLYFEDRLDADAWHGATEDRQAQALVSATRRIDREPLLGKRADGTQALAFPRCLLSGSTGYGGPLDLVTTGWACDDEVPQDVKDATCEQALFLLSLTGYERDRQRQHVLGVIGGRIGGASEYSDGRIVRGKPAWVGIVSGSAGIVAELAGGERGDPVIERYLTQGATWARTLGPNAYGELRHGSGEPIAVRWDWQRRLVRGDNGNYVVSEGRALTLAGVERDDRLTLADGRSFLVLAVGPQYGLSGNEAYREVYV